MFFVCFSFLEGETIADPVSPVPESEEGAMSMLQSGRNSDGGKGEDFPLASVL